MDGEVDGEGVVEDTDEDVDADLVLMLPVGLTDPVKGGEEALLLPLLPFGFFLGLYL